MAIYDTEEEQVEQLKKWWDENSSSLIAGVIAAIVAVIGWNLWQDHSLQQRVQASDTYQQLLDAVNQNDSLAIDALAGKLSSEHASTTYADFAALHKAKIKVDSGDLDGAKAILQQQMQDTRSDNLAHVARLRLVQLMLASGQHEQGLELIAAIDRSKAEGFLARYDELEGDLYVAMDRLDEARNAYQNAIRSGQASPLTQFKLDDLTVPAFQPAASQP
ncbi:MAG: tetratricopeptide repeat protein [Methylomonas sp.]|nr:tetratricopeptide repeat protein [Methylomonas sp.]PPD20940.1 MAG: hypothetical protein CTY23_06905 [Methylomonas sp.]PPD23715.1 MAG: hypothetical protein CTY22_11880 [Methylomonas sp.]PPD31649.1 MAG: hypothetical protein CTY21_11955 [Methylomonas sp.]PPD41295.1 MAG: hypothetical protein CTY17_04035 [Methylomonas sp.]